MSKHCGRTIKWHAYAAWSTSRGVGSSTCKYYGSVMHNDPTALKLHEGSVLGLRPPRLKFRILCLEGSAISPSSGRSPGPV